MNFKKELVFGKQSRDELIEGINKVADAVSSTMGAQGRNVIYETKGGLPKSTKDGVTVASEILLQHPVQSLGAEIVKEASKKTVDECGDSTTSTVVLAREIIKLANEEVNKGSHPIEIKRGIETATKEVLDILSKTKKKIKKSDYFHIANISANNDRALGKIISEAFKKAGKNGVVLQDKSHNEETFIKETEGMLIDRGFANKGMINKPESQTLELQNPYLFVCEQEIDSFQQLMFLYEFLGKNQEDGKKIDIVIIGDLTKEVELILTRNRLEKKFPIYYIKAPAHASKRKDLMEDIAIATNAVFFSKEKGDDFLIDGASGLGQCLSLRADENETILEIDKEKNQVDIDKQIKSLEVLKSKAKESRHKMQREFLNERIAKLSCSIVSIMVGANSEVELNEKLDRVDDAVNALRSAIEEGILIGGGLALYNASYKLNRNSKNNQSFNIGQKILQEAVRKPFKQILENAGFDDTSEIENTILNSDKENLGYDVSKFEFCDFIERGIIDPHKAIRCALQNASSVASTFLLTNTAITIKRN